MTTQAITSCPLVCKNDRLGSSICEVRKDKQIAICMVRAKRSACSANRMHIIFKEPESDLCVPICSIPVTKEIEEATILGCAGMKDIIFIGSGLCSPIPQRNVLNICGTHLE